MRTWLVLAAVFALVAAAAADALRGALRDGDHSPAPAAEARIVPPGVPTGFMGTVFYSDPADECRLHSLRLAGFTGAPPPKVRECRFSLSPDGTQAAPEGSAWSPLGGLVAVPRDDGFVLEAAAGQTIVVRGGRAPAFKPDGTLTQVRGGELVEWSVDCDPGERLFTMPADNATARCVHTVYPHPPTSIAWFSNSRFVAVLPTRRLVIAEDRRILVRATLPRFRTASLELSPQRSFATLWLDGELAGTFDAEGGPLPIAPVGEVTSLAWAPSERWLLAGTRGGAVFLLRPDARDARVRRLDISARDLAWR